MTSTEYRDLLRTMPCVFCHAQGDGVVSWHHLLCLGLHGKGMKSPDWATIPVCKVCHTDGRVNCHNYGFSREQQKKALVKTWHFALYMLGKDNSQLGAVDVDSVSGDYWMMMGKVFWGILNAKA